MGVKSKWVPGRPPPELPRAAQLLKALSRAVLQFSAASAWEFESTEQVTDAAGGLITIAQHIAHERYTNIQGTHLEKLGRLVRMAIWRRKPVEDQDKQPADRGALSPSRVKAAAVYEWAVEVIPDADEMPIRDLFPAILERLNAEISKALPGAGEVEKWHELRDSLPDNAETFAKYLRDAGIKRYDARGKRAQRTSQFKPRDQLG